MLGQFPLKGYWKWEMFHTIIFFLFWVIISFLCITCVLYYVGDDSEAGSVGVDVLGVDVVEVEVMEIEITEVDTTEVDFPEVGITSTEMPFAEVDVMKVDFWEKGIAEVDFSEVGVTDMPFEKVEAIARQLEAEEEKVFDWAGSA